jgi:hypothetical protein
MQRLVAAFSNTNPDATGSRFFIKAVSLFHATVFFILAFKYFT